MGPNSCQAERAEKIAWPTDRSEICVERAEIGANPPHQPGALGDRFPHYLLGRHGRAVVLHSQRSPDWVQFIFLLSASA
jgi:hypothetical protein